MYGSPLQCLSYINCGGSYLYFRQQLFIFYTAANYIFQSIYLHFPEQFILFSSAAKFISESFWETEFWSRDLVNIEYRPGLAWKDQVPQRPYRTCSLLLVTFGNGYFQVFQANFSKNLFNFTNYAVKLAFLFSYCCIQFHFRAHTISLFSVTFVLIILFHLLAFQTAFPPFVS